MKQRKIFGLLAAVIVTLSMTSCHMASPDADEEAVLIKKPWFFGHGGVDDDAVESGLTWCVWSTSVEYFKTVPVRYDESFDDIFSNDNTPLDFNTYINIQIEKGKSPILMKNYGTDWYKNNIQVFYRNKTREQVSRYSPFDLISNREILNRIDSTIIADVKKYVEKLSHDKEFPIIICSVTTGAAHPNKDQMAEMNQTAAAIQAAQTQQRKKEMEQQREAAERQRAIADKAYMNEMNLSASQFIQLRAWDIIKEKQGANIDVLFNAEGTTKMWNVK